MQKKGISLIVLVITIIVMIILAASVVISMSNTGIIDKADYATQLTDKKQVENLAALTWAELYTEGIKEQFILETKVNEKMKESGIDTKKYNLMITNTGITVQEKKAALNEYGFYFDIEYVCNGFNPGDGNIGNSRVILTEDGVTVEHIITNRKTLEGASVAGHDFFGYTWYAFDNMKYNVVHTGKASFNSDASVYYDENGLYHARFEYSNLNYEYKKAYIDASILTFNFSDDGKSFEVLGQVFNANVN